jgi:hypothetical protein
MRRLRVRLTIEAACGLVSLALCLLTLLNREWIEALTGFEPDAGSGALEWGIVIAFAAAAIACGALALRDRRRLRAVGN